MKNIKLKSRLIKIIGLTLFFSMISPVSSNVFAGNDLSIIYDASSDQDMSEDLPQKFKCSENTYVDVCNLQDKNVNFEILIDKYKDIIENQKPASILENIVLSAMEKSLYFPIHNFFSGPGEIDRVENCFPGKYFLRVNYQDEVIYTIRKFHGKYVCVFYVFSKSFENLEDKRLSVKNLLLPIDKPLFR